MEKLARDAPTRLMSFSGGIDGGEDDGDEVSKLTQEVTRSLGRCSETLKRLRRSAEMRPDAATGATEARLVGNIVTGMAGRLREAAEKFGAVQGRHLKSKSFLVNTGTNNIVSTRVNDTPVYNNPL